MQGNKTCGNDRLNKIILFALTLGWGLCFVLRLNIPTMIDEVGTSANAAFLRNWDWSETVWSMGGYYYKYALALIYYPIMLVCRDSYVMYKTMLSLNAVLLALIPVFSYEIARKHLNEAKTESFLLALTTGIFPSTLLNMTYAKADTILIFLPFPITLILLELGKLRTKGVDPENAGRNKKKRVLLSVLLAVLMMLAYMTHTRGIVIILAVLFSILFIRLICRIPTVEYVSFFITTAALYLADRKIAGFFKDALYGEYGTLHASAESYDLEGLKLLLSGSGIRSFLKLAAGIGFNVLVSAYGLCAVAVIGGIILTVRYLRNRAEASNEEISLVMIALLLFFGTFAMNCLFLFPYVHRFYTGEDMRRADWLVYGRYMSCAAGPVVFLGLYFLIRKIKALTGILSIALYSGTTALFMLKVVPYMQDVSFVSRNFIQLCTFVELSGYGLTTGVIEGIGEAFLKAAVLSGGIGTALIAFSFIPDSGKRLKTIVLTVIFGVASVALTVINYDNIRISRDTVLMSWISEPCEVLEDVRELAEEYPVLVDSSAKEIKHYQFVCKEYTLGNKTTKVAEAQNCFIIARKKYFVKEFYNDDYYVFDSFDYSHAKKDIVYIKGAQLAEKLREMGFSISKYDGALMD